VAVDLTVTGRPCEARRKVDRLTYHQRSCPRCGHKSVMPVRALAVVAPLSTKLAGKAPADAQVPASRQCQRPLDVPHDLTVCSFVLCRRRTTHGTAGASGRRASDAHRLDADCVHQCSQDSIPSVTSPLELRQDLTACCSDAGQRTGAAGAVVAPPTSIALDADSTPPRQDSIPSVTSPLELQT
jgi:hypothetical protein